jgi:hypothetical protein
MGPMITPIMPNMKMPPMVPKKIISSCICVSLPTRIGLQQVVQAADHQRTEDEQSNRLAHGPAESENDRCRQPDHRGSHAGNDGQHHHDHAPEGRTGNAHRPESQAGQPPLEDTDNRCALQGGAGHRGEAFQHLLLVIVLKRQVIEYFLQQFFPVHQKKIHGVKPHEKHEQKVDRPMVADERLLIRNWLMPPTSWPALRKITSLWGAIWS